MQDLINWLKDGDNQHWADLYASHLSSGFCHELNNIFTAMLGNISMAKLFLDKNPEKALTKLADAEKALNRARNLVSRVHQTSTKRPIILNKLPLLPIIRTEMAQFNDERLQLECLPAGWQPVIMGSEELFRAAINNAISNACEAQGEDQAAIPITVQRMTIAEQDYCEIAITNGLSQEGHSVGNYLVPYNTEKAGHSGLGLAIIRSAITLHQGQMDFTLSAVTATLKLRFPVQLD